MADGAGPERFVQAGRVLTTISVSRAEALVRDVTSPPSRAAADGSSRIVRAALWLGREGAVLTGRTLKGLGETARSFARSLEHCHDH